MQGPVEILEGIKDLASKARFEGRERALEDRAVGFAERRGSGRGDPLLGLCDGLWRPGLEALLLGDDPNEGRQGLLDTSVSLRRVAGGRATGELVLDAAVYDPKVDAVFLESATRRGDLVA